MSVDVTIELNGVHVPVTLHDAALQKIAAALGSRSDQEAWPAWMSAETVARYLDCPVERVRKLVGGRAIPFVQEAPGCRVFFERKAIDDWMRQSAQPAGGGEA